MEEENNPSMDALCTAAFVENYFDWIDNLPDDVQRQLTRMRELDVGYRSVMQDLQNFGEQLENDDFESPATRKTLFKMEQILIALQEAGDDKVEISQHITDFIDNKGRQIEQDRKNLESDSGEPTKETVKESNQSERSSAVVSNNGNASEKNSNSANERASKRARRSRADENSEQVETRTTTAKAGNPNPVSSAGKAAAAAKKKKRKCRQREETPPKEEEVVPEIDEPTYCLCDQISYGEMIMCDNDLCPIEWFHFVCVSLNTKPKGKWFCPRCRGDRPNVMKPKSQFLKELEKYNKEKEEKA